MSTGPASQMDIITERLAARGPRSPMRVVERKPPGDLFDRIDALLHIRHRPVIITYGSLIYAPMGGEVGPALIAHEEEHYRQQTDDEAAILAWWDRWLADPEFRLAQELPAHAAEYRMVCKMVHDSNERARFLMNVIAKRLSDPIYGNLISLTEAARRIRELSGVEKKRRPK